MSTSNFVETTRSPSIEFSVWRLIWEYEGDRWGHRLQFLRDGTWHDLLASETNGTCVLQDLFLEQRPDGGAEFQGMGQSAVGIHSASIVCDAETKSISFDLATRFRTLESLSLLWMEYRRSPNSSPNKVRIEPLGAPKAGDLSIEGETASTGNTRIEWRPSTGELAPSIRSGGGLTVQWGYRLQW